MPPRQPQKPIAPTVTPVEMRFPLAGVDRTMGFDRQPNRPMVNGDYARTTVSAKNVRAFDPLTDRARGGSRPGIAKFSTNQVSGSNPIQDVGCVTVTALITGGTGTVPGWGVSTPHIFLRKPSSVDLSYGSTSSAWSFSFLGSNYSMAAIGDAAGSTAFAISGVQSETPSWRLISNGSQVATGEFPANASTGSISVATDGTSYYAVFVNQGAADGTFGALKVSTTGTVTWSTANLGTLSVAGNYDLPTSTVIRSGVIYTTIVGTGIVQINATTGAVGSPMIRLSAATIRNTGGAGTYSMSRGMAVGGAMTGSYLANATDTLAIAVESNLTGNYRQGIVFYNLGSSTFTPSGIFGNSIVDANDTAQSNRVGQRLQVVSDGTHFYALLDNPTLTLTSGDAFVVKVSGTTGAELWGSARYGARAFMVGYSSSLSKVIVSGPGVSSFLDPTTGADGGGGLGTYVKSLYDAGSINTLGDANSDDLDTVGGYNRALCLTGISNGTLKVLFHNEWQSVNAGGGSLSSTARRVRNAVLRRKMYFVDDNGTNYSLYNPVTNSLDAWTPTEGTMPVDGIGKKARLIAAWRDRAILSGLPEDPSNVFASKSGDARNWNYSPASQSPLQAWALNAAGAGQIPDIVTALMPYSDDVCFIGCDHELWALSGDPAAGGKLDMVSRQTGVAWGNAWCMDTFGNIYFLSNHTGVYRMVPGEQPTRISQPIDSMLADIDLRKNVINLVWNDRRQGLRVYVTNIVRAQPCTHYFWEQRSGAWQPDEFADEDFNPLCCTTFAGNTGNNRTVILGSFDGYVRFETDDAPNDDGVSFESDVWLGPILTKDLDDLLLKEIQAVLGKDAGQVTYEVYVGKTAEEAFYSTARETGSLFEGRSTTIPARWAGHAIYLRLTSTNAWALESIRMMIQGTGMVRRREA